MLNEYLFLSLQYISPGVTGLFRQQTSPSIEWCNIPFDLPLSLCINSSSDIGTQKRFIDEINSQLSRCCTARGSSAQALLGGTSKVGSCKFCFIYYHSHVVTLPCCIIVIYFLISISVTLFVSVITSSQGEYLSLAGVYFTSLCFNALID